MCRPWFYPVALLALAGLAQASDPSAADSKLAVRVKELVRELGGDDFDRRQSAQKELVAIGPVALPIIDKLEPFAGPEMESRIRTVRRTIGGAVEELREVLAAYANSAPGTPRVPSPKTRKLIADHQPALGDFLLALIADPKHSLRLEAIATFGQIWDLLTPDQIRTYLEREIQFSIIQRRVYPRGVDAMIGMGHAIRDGWSGLPLSGRLKMVTDTIHTLDGKPYGKPYHYPSIGCTTGWIRTKELAVGKHEFSVGVKFEVEFESKTIKGSVQSLGYTFEILPAETPDELAAPKDAAIEKLIRGALKFTETDDPGLGQVQLKMQVGRGLGPTPDVDWWTPSVLWTGKDGKANGLHLPGWRLENGLSKSDQPLPVDLAFEVFLRVEETREEYSASSVVVIKRESSLGVFQGTPIGSYRVDVRDVEAVAKGRSGFVPVRIILRSSRAVALTDPRVTKYFTGEIVSEPLRMKVGPGIDTLQQLPK